MNEYCWSDTAGYTVWNGKPKIRRAQILRPSTLGIFADEGTVVLPWGPVVINNLCLGVGNYKVPGSYCDALGAFHNPPDGDITRGKANVAYGDGHVSTEASTDGKEIFTPWLYKQ
jgi:prepilin-type processing-associated H-X9-DG protein